MVLSLTFLSFLFLSFHLIFASSLIHRGGGKGTLRFSTRLRTGLLSGQTLPDTDHARVRALVRNLSKRNDSSIAITNDIFDYVAQVGVGDPPHYYALQIDTGSSNVWVGANGTNPYVLTNTSVDTGDTFAVSYGSGAVFGEEWRDTVTLSPDLVIKSQSIGVASSTNGSFEGLDGIFGVGPLGLTQKTVYNTSTVHTVMDNLHSQGMIHEEVLGVYFVPSFENASSFENARHGELTFGGYDSGVITTPMEYVPLTTTPGASSYWGANQSVLYDGEIIQRNAAGIIDTGTTLVLLELAAFKKYQNVTGATLDISTQLLSITPVQYENLKPLSFSIGDLCLDLVPDAQIWPRALNTAMGGNASAIYLIVSYLPPGIDFGFIDGYAFLERFYSVYDTTNHRVGFAKTAYTESVINSKLF